MFDATANGVAIESMELAVESVEPAQARDPHAADPTVTMDRSSERERRGSWSVRLARAGDEELLRRLRIEALTDSPENFCSTLERERSRTTADWRRWFSPGATFLLERRGVPRGLVCAAPRPGDPAAVSLVSMWVEPELRGSGAADALVEALLTWARERRFAQVWLDVVKGNERALRFYERHGFRTTGRETPRGTLVEVEMRRDLEPPAPPADEQPGTRERVPEE